MKTYRTESRFYVRKAVSVAILTIVTLLINSRFPSFALWMLYLMLVLFCCGNLSSLLRTYLKIGEAELQGWGNGEEVYARWSELAYARREEEKPGKYWLVLATKDATHAMPLELLDAEAIWQEVQQRAPREALADDAAERLEKLQVEAWEQRVGALQGPFTLTVGRRFIILLLLAVIGWGVIGLLTPMLFTPEWVVRALVCLSVAVLLTLIFFLSLAHTLHVTEDGLSIRTVRGYFQMSWNELEKVRADAGNSVVVFEGNDKRVVCAPFLLGGHQKASAMEFITLRLRERQISVTREARLLALPVRSSKSAWVKIKRKRDV